MILITGMHRSATTFIGKTISQHEDVKYIHEPFNVAFPNKHASFKLNTWFEDIQFSNNKQEILNGILKLSVPNKITLVKDPLALMSADTLHKENKMTVICIERSALPFIASLKQASWDFGFNNFKKQSELIDTKLKDLKLEICDMCENNNSTFIDRAILLWKVLNHVISNYKKEHKDWLFLKHEDITYNPLKELNKTFYFLNINLDNSIIEYVKDFTTNKTNNNLITSYNKRNSKELNHLWKTRLTKQEIKTIKNKTGL